MDAWTMQQDHEVWAEVYAEADDERFAPSEPEAPVDCPLCGGAATFLGTLGAQDWFRCRHCGADYHADRIAAAANDLAAR